MPFISATIGAIRRNKWRSIIAAVVAILLVLFVRRITRPNPPQYITATATRGDLVQTAEAVGTVTSEKDLDLQFRTAGIIDQVPVKEGDHVHRGQKLATIRAGSLTASIASAAAHVQEMEASLDALKAGSRPEDIAVAKANLANKKAQLGAAKETLQNAKDAAVKSQAKLDALQRQSTVNISGDVSTAPNAANGELTAAEQALGTIDDVFAKNDVDDSMQRGNPSDEAVLRSRIASARAAIRDARSSPQSVDVPSAARFLQNARAAVAQTSSVLDRAYDIIAHLPQTSTLTASAIASYKTTIAAQRTAIQTSLRTLDSAITDLQNLPAGLQTQIAAEETNLQNAQNAEGRAAADLRTYETSVQIDEAQLQLKLAGSRPEDISVADARLKQAQAELARAAAEYSDTILTAPNDGIVTNVNVKAGEASPVGSAVSIMGDSPYRIEMFVSEVDIPKVALSQSGSIELDAFRGTHFRLRVSEIDAAATNKDGVSKYRVKLDFVYPHPELKIGMTGDAAIVTGVRRDVVSVPMRAVLDAPDGGTIVRVLDAKGLPQDRRVTVGMEGGNGHVEIPVGIRPGETVVVLVKN
ncbi:efflux RND transporter periplasmic adaptor subunit [Candidatus Peregrinibacteria bacterium]|nr:efflux RND transporter periplasmic adaptor subunit [Candidatus Peregrinibacteria bacterium]MBI3816885.1 efflux RND transporter periplasmic adaptor subunit [Candidatus Peregrinibacteria bacterium]